MMYERDRTDLPWQFFKRRVKPLALSASVGVAAVAIGPLFSSSNELFDFQGPLGIVMSVCAAVLFVFFWVGWWFRLAQLEQWALLGTAGVFISRATLGFLSVGFVHPAPWISFAMSIGAGGAYLLERAGGGRYE